MENTMEENAERHLTKDQDQPLPIGEFGKIDLAKFRIPQEGLGEGQTERIMTTVRVGKPTKTAFFRVNPAQNYRMLAGIVEVGAMEPEAYLVVGALCEALLEEATFSTRMLVTAVTLGSTPFIWPLKMSTDNSWTRSAHDAAEIAEKRWIRLKANSELRAYELIAAVNQNREPVWPALSFEELVDLAFRGRVIDTADHPVLRQLRGE
ncbi:MAG TPA: hypothetical protein VJU77_19005 [Chthoniobacterales bacterium]|nr:hypothetical protein [Chthoniobacterales bacterium]